MFCGCPRCPLRKIQPCYICGLEDDRDCIDEKCRNCTDKECIVQEHYVFRDELYCQICVENKYGFVFRRAQLGMYCDDHKKKHESRPKTKIRLMRLLYFPGFIEPSICRQRRMVGEGKIAVMETMKPVFIEDEKRSERKRKETEIFCIEYELKQLHHYTYG
jgi:hypothetical protein